MLDKKLLVKMFFMPQKLQEFKSILNIDFDTMFREHVEGTDSENDDSD